MSIVAKWEKKEGNEGELTINVSVDEFDKALNEAYKKVVKTVSLPGFRKGRIPRNIFEKQFGVESLYQDAVDIVLPTAYEEAIDQTGIFPINQPQVDIEQIEKGKELISKAIVTVKTEEDEITDEEVENNLENLRENHAELVLKEDGTVENGDTVVIDFEGFIDGEAFEGGKAENHSLEIGSQQFIPGFEEQLIGKPANEETEIEVTFPEDYQQTDFAGKKATFKVMIHEIKQKELPELDDDFAQDVDEEVETLDELKEKKKEELLSSKETEAENKKRESLLLQASENAEVEIPEVMIETELNNMLQEFEQRVQMQGMTLENYYELSGETEESIKGQMKEDAEKRVKSNLTLEAILEAEELEVDDSDVDAELEEMAKMYSIDKEQILGMLGGNADVLKEDLKIKKALNFIVEQAKAV